MTTPSHLGRKARALLNAGKSTAEVAAVLGVSRAELRRILSGRYTGARAGAPQPHSLAIAPETSSVFCRLLDLERFVSENLVAVELFLEPRHADLPLMDRVLLTLVPSMEHDVVRFHGGQGPDLVAMFEGHQIDHLDKDLVAVLRKKVIRKPPRRSLKRETGPA